MQPPICTTGEPPTTGGDHDGEMSIDAEDRSSWPIRRKRLWDRLGSAVLRSLAPESGEAGAIYGLILVGSLMAAESYKHDLLSAS